MKVYVRSRSSENSNIQYIDNNKMEITHNGNKYFYEFEKIWQNTNTRTIFNELHDNKCTTFYWIAFGYSGTGKSFTCSNLIKCLLETHHKNNIYFSSYQIYRNEIIDMITGNKLKFNKTKNGLYVQNQRQITIKNYEHYQKLINKHKIIAKTKNNDRSSRGHLFTKIKFDEIEYNIIDLAGQEKGDIMLDTITNNELKCINSDLLCLKTCIEYLYKNKTHIPYRNSLLTSALKPIFSNCINVSFICTINFETNMFQQLDTLKYASYIYNSRTTFESNQLNLFENDVNDFYSSVENDNICEMLHELKHKPCHTNISRIELKLNMYKLNINKLIKNLKDIFNSKKKIYIIN